MTTIPSLHMHFGLLLAGLCLGLTGEIFADGAHPPPSASTLRNLLPEGVVLRIGSENFRHPDVRGETQVVYAPDGLTVLAASQGYGAGVPLEPSLEDVIDVWDAATGRRLDPLIGRKVAFSGDGSSVAILGAMHVRFHAWPFNRQAPRLEMSRQTRDLLEFAYAPDGNIVLLVTCYGSEEIPSFRWNSRRLEAWDVSTGTQLWQVDLRKLNAGDGGRRRQQYGVAFSPRGAHAPALVWTPDTASLIDPVNGRHVFDLVDSSEINAAKFTSDGESIIASRRQFPTIYDGSEYVFQNWSTATGEVLDRNPSPFAPHQWPDDIDVSPDQRDLVVGTRGRGSESSPLSEIGVIDRVTKTVRWRRPLVSVNNRVPSVAFSPDGSEIVTAAGGLVRFWDSRTGRELTPVTPDPAEASSAALAPDGSLLAIGVPDDVSRAEHAHVRRIDVSTGRQLDRLPGAFAHTIKAVEFSPDGAWLAAGDSRGMLRVWNAATGTTQFEFSWEHNSDNTEQALTFSHDGRWLAAISNSRLRIWDSTQDWASLPASSHPAVYIDRSRLTFLPQRPALLVERFWFLRLVELEEDRSRILRLQRYQDNLSCVAFSLSPDGRTAAAIVRPVSDGPTHLRLIETATWSDRTRKELPDSTGITAIVMLDERRIACGERDGGITLRDAWSGETLARYDAHRQTVRHMQLCADRSKFLSCGGTVLVWDANLLPKAQARPTHFVSPEQLWSDLGAAADEAFPAIQQLISRPQFAVEFLAERIAPSTRPDPDRVRELIVQLDSDQFAERDAAGRELAGYGALVKADLERAQESPSAEVRIRARTLLRRISDRVPIRSERALEVLESLKTDSALRLLEELASGVAEDPVTIEAKRILYNQRH